MWIGTDGREAASYTLIPVYATLPLYPDTCSTSFYVSAYGNLTVLPSARRPPEGAVRVEGDKVEVDPGKLEEGIFYEVTIGGEKYYLVKSGRAISVFEAP